MKMELKEKKNKIFNTDPNFCDADPKEVERCRFTINEVKDESKLLKKFMLPQVIYLIKKAYQNCEKNGRIFRFL